MATSSFHPASKPTHSFINQLIELADDEDIQVGDSIDFESEDGEYLEGAKVLSMDDEGLPKVSWDEGGETKIYQLTEDDYPSLHSSPRISSAWERHLHADAVDGVAWCDQPISDDLRARLQAGFDALCNAEPDYHPGSGTIVRDLVHPSLYPYIKGKSALADGAKLPSAQATNEEDVWGRPYEDSIYQWLPTPFVVDAEGGVTIDGYINNLDRETHGPFYEALAELFAAELPLFESVCGYVDGMQFMNDELEGEHELPHPPSRVEPLGEASPRSLRGRELQVITKVVEYRLGAGEDFEGVWHVEGMSHEHILATGVYTLSRDEAFEGGTLRFKRPYSQHEAGQLFWNVPQCRPREVNEIVDEGLIPVGSIDTRADRAFVFPNSHVHKLTTMKAADGADEARRRVIVFWLVDPDHPIISTREVPPQQGRLSLDEAKAIRLELMQERRVHKQSLNVRAVSLCEH